MNEIGKEKKNKVQSSGYADRQKKRIQRMDKDKLRTKEKKKSMGEA